MSKAAQPYPRLPGLEVDEAKDAWRSMIRQARGTRSASRREQAAHAFAGVVLAIPQVQEARCVSAYSSRPGEPDTGPLLEALAARGLRVLLPVLGAGLQRDWALYTGPDDLRERAPGRPPEPGTAPLGPAALADADVVVVPALAVDTSGTRLGQGGGWYDRALEHARRDALLVALVFPEELYDAQVHPLPREPHDRRVDAVATTQRLHRLRTPGAGRHSG